MVLLLLIFFLLPHFDPATAISSIQLDLDLRRHHILVPSQQQQHAIENFTSEVIRTLYLDGPYRHASELIEQQIQFFSTQNNEYNYTEWSRVHLSVEDKELDVFRQKVKEKKLRRDRSSSTTATNSTASTCDGVTLIWQIHPSNPWSSSAWIREMLHGMIAKEIIDTNFTVVLPNSLIIYPAEMCEEHKTERFMNYITQFDKLQLKYGLINLHDEIFGGCRANYATANVVLRAYGHPSFADRGNVLAFPLGYQRHRSTKLSAFGNPNVQNRKYDWGFAGDVTKLWRSNMLDEMTQALGTKSSMIHTTTSWLDQQSLPGIDYTQMLDETKFAPAPFGIIYKDTGQRQRGLISSFSTFRFWEALESGAIPIRERVCRQHIRHTQIELTTVLPILIPQSQPYETFWKNMMARDEHDKVPFCDDVDVFAIGTYNDDLLSSCPVPVVRIDWSDVAKQLNPLLNNVTKLEELSTASRLWYQDIKKRTKAAVQSHVKQLLLEEFGPLWDRLHHPSRVVSILYSGIYYVFQPMTLCRGNVRQQFELLDALCSSIEYV